MKELFFCENDNYISLVENLVWNWQEANSIDICQWYKKMIGFMEVIE